MARCYLALCSALKMAFLGGVSSARINGLSRVRKCTGFPKVNARYSPSSTYQHLHQFPMNPFTSLGAVAESSKLASAHVFEPIVNVPALGSFLVIAVVFSLLLFRIRSVEDAVERRKAALAKLRAIKIKELSCAGEECPAESSVAAALREYEEALRAEDDMRTLLPGVRIVAPNRSAASSDEDIVAAKQFLGIDLVEPAQQQQTEETEANKGLSPAAVALLAVVAVSQLALLYMLSFDPMSASW